MKQRTTVGFMALFAGVLLATVSSVSANHAAAGKGTYAVAPQVFAKFHVVVAKQGPNPEPAPGLNVVQSEVVGRGGARPFEAFLVSTAIAPIEIPPEPAERTVTITGELVSTTFLGVGHERRAIAELVPFTAIGVDKETPEAGPDLFSLTVEYSATEAQGPLFASLGFGSCQAATCTITFEGPVKTGDIFVHTAGGE